MLRKQITFSYLEWLQLLGYFLMAIGGVILGWGLIAGIIIIAGGK